MVWPRYDRRHSRHRQGSRRPADGKGSPRSLFPYRLLWERSVRSVANLTRADAWEFLTLAGDIPLDVHVRVYSVADANLALSDLRTGRLSGAAVLVP